MRNDVALSVKNLNAWYGDAHALHGVDLELGRGEVVTLLGRNGSGRTTTLKSILGLMDRCEGNVCINGQDVTGLAPHRVARLGVGYCPEERGIFSSLTCAENLSLLPKVGARGVDDEQIYAMFPNLRDRRNSPAGRLSGGEKQMLAMARILRAGADILLLDEITEGLAPVIVERLAEVILALRERGFTMLLVEQNFEFASDLADRHYVMESGRVVGVVAKHELASRQAVMQEYLGV